MHVPVHVAKAFRLAAIAALLGLILPIPPIAGTAGAAGNNDPSDIVLVLDFSGSILVDKAIRRDFADALDGIAARVEETSVILTAGDATVSILRFATKAADLPDCTGLQLRQNADAVAKLADCLRRVAAAYRKGVDPVLTRAIGKDTNYVAAMEKAAVHVPADSARPAIIFFTDGRHDAAAVPVSKVIPARDRLFATRTPFALLPVGMGVDPNDRPRLEAGLAQLRIVTPDFEGCEGGLLEWPAVVFESPEAAGRAVALALQNVSCTFTVEPTPTPPPTPTPEPPAPVGSISVTPGDAEIKVAWVRPADAGSSPIEDYRVRCRPSAGGDWIESTEGVSTETSATVTGLSNGVEYGCEVSPVRSSGLEVWTPAAVTALPVGLPPAPSKPDALPLDTGVHLVVAMPDAALVTGFDFECSADGGTTFPIQRQVHGDRGMVDIGGLTNGTEYVCRAFATNGSGTGDASPLSDVFRPCSGVIGCNSLLLIPIGGLVVLLLGLLLFFLIHTVRGRAVWVTAQIDQFAPVSLGRGPRVGMMFVTRGPQNRVAGVTPAEGRKADIRIRYVGGVTFQVSGGGRRRKTEFGRVVEVTDPDGRTHELVLRAYDQPPS
jgi:Fibronectin type III domain